MQYAQLNEDGTYSHQITTSGNVEWDANNFCPAAALVKDGKAEQFRIVELHETDAPEIDPLTQSVMRDGGEFVGGRWQYKWRVDALSEVEAGARRKAMTEKILASIKSSVQIRLESFAATRDYKSVDSIGKYIALSDDDIESMPAELRQEAMKIRAESRYLSLAVTETWAKCYAMLAEVRAGDRPIPTGYSEIEQELPSLEWPVAE